MAGGFSRFFRYLSVSLVLFEPSDNIFQNILLCEVLFVLFSHHRPHIEAASMLEKLFCSDPLHCFEKGRQAIEKSPCRSDGTR